MLLFDLLAFEELILSFGEFRLGLVELDAVFIDGFLNFLDGLFVETDLVAGIVEGGKIFFVDGVNVVPIVHKLSAIGQVKIHEQFFGSEFEI